MITFDLDFPTYLLVGVCASLLVIIVWSCPKFFVLTGGIITIFSGTIVELTNQAWLSYFDELYVLVALLIFPLRRLVLERRIIWVKTLSPLIILLLVGCISSLSRDVPFTVTVVGAFLMLKWFLFSFAIAQLEWNIDDIKRGMPPLLTVGIIILICGVINFMFPNVWVDIFAETADSTSRFGRTSLVGPFTHPSIFAVATAFFAIACLTYRAHIKKTGLTLFLAFIATVLSIFALRRRLWVALTVSIAWIMSRDSKRATLVIGSLIALQKLTVQ